MKQTIHDLATKMQAFAANIDNEVSEAVNSVEKEIMDLNRKQLLSSQNALGKPLIHESTKSEFLTPAYAKRTGKKKPNIFVDGSYQNGMQFDSPTLIKVFGINSIDYKYDWLVKNYKDLHGISPINQAVAKGYTNWAIAQRIKAKCFK